VQGRQIFVYATAGALGWDGPWREAVEHGLDFLLTKQMRADGLIRTLLNPDGSPADETAVLYDQAFALLALAAASKALPNRKDIAPAAQRLRGALATFRHPGGGFREASADRPFQANCQMHLFEAALAWEEAAPSPAWTALADEMATLAMTRFIDENGRLHEAFGPDWGPTTGIDGRIIEPGHQFEWAWLLERWSRLRGDPAAHTAALSLFEAGKAGVDARRGVAMDELLDDLTVHKAGARLWPQTEWIKASMILSRTPGLSDTDRAAYRAEAAAALAALTGYFDTPVEGLWRDKLSPGGTFTDEPAPASSFYHIVAAAIELAAG
jgi:mannose-6-phosphate isomerase